MNRPTINQLLAIIALICAILSLVIHFAYLLPIAVILLAIAMLI